MTSDPVIEAGSRGRGLKDSHQIEMLDRDGSRTLRRMTGEDDSY